MAANRQQQLNGDVNITGNLTVGGQIINGLTQQVGQLQNSPPSASLGAAYRSPALYPASALTSVPTAPSIHVVPSQKALVITWDFQGDLSNFQRYEIQCSADGTNWYSLSNNMTTGLGTLGALTQTASEIYVHVLPAGTTLYYRVRRVNMVSGADNDGPWSTSVSNVSGDSTAPSIAAATIYAQMIVVGDLYFTDKVASQTNPVPAAGDLRSYLEKGDLHIDEYIGSSWQSLFSVDAGSSANLLDLFISGKLKSAGGVYSASSPLWQPVTISAFTGDVYALMYDGSTLLAGTAQGELGYSTDNGLTFTKVTSPFTSSDAVTQFAMGGTTVVAITATGKIAYSTDAGSAWTGATSPFTTVSSVAGITWNGAVFVAASGVYRSHSSDGVTWSAEILDTYALGNLASIGTTVVGAGEGSELVEYSNDNGVTWTAVTGLGHPIEGTIASTGSRFVVGAANGYIGYSDDLGLTWTWLPTTDAGNIITVAFAEGMLYAGSTASTVRVSSDLGLTWTNANAPFSSGYLHAVAAYDMYRYAVADTLQGALSVWSEAGAGIVETGSNSNGSWIKWADGTMDCDATLYFQVSEYDITWSYPAVFTAPPRIVTGVGDTTTPNDAYVFLGYPMATVSQALFFVRGAAPSSQITVIYASARGKWK